MDKFSDRYGYTKHRDAYQLEEMDGALRIALYNAVYQFLHECNDESIEIDALVQDMWDEYSHKPLDAAPTSFSGIIRYLHEVFGKRDWYEPYNALEFIAANIDYLYPVEYAYTGSRFDYDELTHDFNDMVNQALEREMSGYRMISGKIIPITNEGELWSLRESVSTTGPYSGVAAHIQSAIDHLSAKPEPDFRNTIKEAISAVEAAAGVACGDEKASLGQALKLLGKDNRIHPALLKGWGEIYGFTSDAGGIRHGSSGGDVPVDSAMAKYMLISCSAFANYLMELGSLKGGA